MTASDTQPGLTLPRLIEVEEFFADPALIVPTISPDGTRPQAQSDRIVASLRELGVPVEYLLAPDEGHDFENEENRLRSYRAVERHLAEHPGGRRGATSEVGTA